MKPVIELLKRPQTTLWHVHPEDSVYEALEVLAEHDVGALLVMDGGKLVGVFSERDYTRKIALEGRSSRDTKVAEIMSTAIVAVSPRTRTRDCMALMKQHHIRHLPVVDGREVLGMISMRDIMQDIIADHELTIAQLENYIHS